MKKILVIETVEDQLTDDYYGGDIDSPVTDNTAVPVTAKTATSLLDVSQIVEILKTSIENKDEYVLNMLKSLGYVNKETLEKADQLVAEKEFWLTRKQSYYGQTVDDLDLDKLTDHTVDALVDEKCQVLQTISKTSLKSLMTEDQKKKYNAGVARREKKKKEQAAAKAAKAESKKQKEIEKAKQLLLEAGELV